MSSSPADPFQAGDGWGRYNRASVPDTSSTRQGCVLCGLGAVTPKRGASAIGYRRQLRRAVMAADL
jgi:hypothetical protein